METKNVLLVLALAAVAYVFMFRYEPIKCAGGSNCIFVVDRITGEVDFVAAHFRRTVEYDRSVKSTTNN